ncbi:Prophage CP4-57 integrase [compost metagenome]
MERPKTLVVQLSDAAIKRHANDIHVTQLRDPRHPLRFRYSRSTRERGSWHVVKFTGGRDVWRKAGNFPELTFKALLAALPEIQQRLAADLANATAIVTTWQTVGDLLRWYRQRAEEDRNLSQDRRDNVRSQINRHLLPALDAIALGELDKALLDQRLYRPLQAEYELSTVRAVFQTLKAAFAVALALKKITTNPLLAVTFRDFTKAKIQPKDGRLTTDRVRELFAQLAEHVSAGRLDHVALFVLMLAHGTRINETRQAKWVHFSELARQWRLPAADIKTRRAHSLPLTAQMEAFLARYREHLIRQSGALPAYLFPGSQSGKPISKRSAQNVFAVLGTGEWTSHDLRKLCRSAWADMGVEYLTGERLVNHAPQNLDATYIHSTLEGQKRVALERWHAWLDEQGFALIHGRALSFGTHAAETYPRQPETLTPSHLSNGAGSSPSAASMTKEDARP